MKQNWKQSSVQGKKRAARALNQSYIIPKILRFSLLFMAIALQHNNNTQTWWDSKRLRKKKKKVEKRVDMIYRYA